MKYIKKFEDTRYTTTEWQKIMNKFHVGDYVYIKDPYSSDFSQANKHDKCKIIDIEEDYPYITIRSERNGHIEEYKYNRLMTEEEYNMEKYNL